MAEIYIMASTGPLLSSTTVEGEPLDLDGTICTFLSGQDDRSIDLSSCLASLCMRLRQETPNFIVVRLFQSLNIQFVLFTSLGRLTGIMTRVSTLLWKLD